MNYLTCSVKWITMLFLFLTTNLFAQNGELSGIISEEQGPLSFASIALTGTSFGCTSDEAGQFSLENIPFGEYDLVISSLGYNSQSYNVILNPEESALYFEIELEKRSKLLGQVVVTGTRTDKLQTDSPIIVQVLSSDDMKDVQACTISEGLRFQPGLRVETDCQTCNYTQLRMNGLGGGYSQILINGRPIFSPLTGLYGMEQIPTNMVERVEVVRGGGSALYGSSSIGGTVNIITKIPKSASYEISHITQWINGQSNDQLLSGNVALLTKSEKAGAAVFISRRHRESYDHQGDGFSELPELRNNSFGLNLYFQPTRNQKLELSLSSLEEYRYGGEMVDKPAYLTQQSEERTHHVLLGSIDYQLNLNEDNSSLIGYFAFQQTDRDHYTGIFPDDETEIENHLINPPYGYSENFTLQAGTQFNHRFMKFPGHANMMTIGMEYVLDDVLDTIQAYSYQVDQKTGNLGIFLQSDWEIIPKIHFLAGLRIDQHNLLEQAIASPRLSLLWKLKEAGQLRLSWGTGFRAPQAFDTDLHIAFAGGGISRVVLAPDLKEERSNSLSASLNYDKAKPRFIAGFTLEGFYTNLKDAFFLSPEGEDLFGTIFQKQNGPGAEVYGSTVEVRANYNKQIQLEIGLSIQRSLHREAIEVVEELEPMRQFLRTPDYYGYLTATWTPNTNFRATINGIHTGPMYLAHLAGAPEQKTDTISSSIPFSEWSIRLAYSIAFEPIDSRLELFGGVKNAFNAYQNDFDSGKYRDSNYVYGPSTPRTIFIGIQLRSK